MDEVSFQRVIAVSIFLVSLSLGQSFACGINVNDVEPKWKFPNDKAFIEKSSKIGVVKGLNFQEEINFQLITYKPNGLLMRAPDGKGFWEFRETYRFLHKGKTFAIAGRAYFPTTVANGKGSSYLGCLTEVVIYDEDGSGSFENIQAKGLIPDHIPAWVLKQVEKK
ncbi:MAG: hypothetical protein JWO13_1891 [Acidobacteriales bacterium]|nr:hypothetical protein [Terriglobales bacterium]